MIRTPKASGTTPSPALFASLAMSMHYVLGIALAMPNAHLSSCPGRGIRGPNGARDCRRGGGAHRVVEPHRPMAARRGRHRLDRQLVLFHPSRFEPEAADRPAPGRAGRRLAGPRRRLLSHGEISRRPRPPAGRADLVQMGGLTHVALG